MSTLASLLPTSAPAASTAIAPASTALLGERADRWFVVGSAWIVPVPILLFLLLRAAGASPGAAADLVTVFVMVPLGGPHVVATFGRTLWNRTWWRRERWLAVASLLLLAAVATTAIASAFLDVRIGGRPPMAWLLTGFFFWAGLHVVQQHVYAAGLLADRAPAKERDAFGAVDVALLVLALYPVALFRMSMADGGVGTAVAADPDALATRIVLALGASPQFADDYVFRIGRATPVLPEFVLHPAFWITITAAWLLALVLFVAKSLRRRRAGLPFGLRGRLVLAFGLLGAVVPLCPDLDSAFQGINAWHSCQYLGIAMLLHRQAEARGEIGTPWLAALARPGRALAAYGIALAATLLLVGVLFAGAFVLERGSGGAFVLFGHDTPPVDAQSGQPLYRPGALLLAYYLVGFGFLLVHYLQDTVHFLRRRAA